MTGAPAPGAVRVLAHGIGAQHDLPLSPFYAFAGAFAALFVSFLALGLLWSHSRFTGERAGRPLPAAVQRLADARATRVTARALGLAAALSVVLWLLLGPADPDRNPAPGAVYVLLWVGLVPASLLLGPVWRLLNPLRTLHLLVCRVLRRDPETGRALPVRLGMWPAAAGLLAFTWLELVAPDPASPTALLLFLGVYAAVHLTGAAVYGARWFDHADAFEVYSGLLARLSPFGRRPADGRLVVRSPFNGLDATPRLPGLVATVCVMLGSTAYDGFSDAPRWITTVQTSALGRTTTATLGLLAAVTLVATLYALCAGATRLVCGGLRHPLTAFAHSLVPIALGYLVAHYFTLFATEGPHTLALASGADRPAVPEPPLGPGGVATLQVLAIVTGHVLGVIAAHDRSVRLMPPRRAVIGQLPLLVLMIAYTVGGLALLIA
ncbi:hypothetical protein K388_05337 [Streptomyces sp. KhCrAH-43]|uniref:hypothetical protein n=1 Tax=unclassified Streptomyces TaxID=2593676 RepID=UPI00036B3D6F|nr:hypothetical protein [Streptomyces sp. KhCrAH-43]MYS32666.1 hypothetical protein [Streptomyces sp. SID4920]MYX68251.1 hypothetical protein [Streptomyces sp. SID8373]RAJ54430.1 hypothetical protein K388_05337 [Streptomyces sp. KhCrAH-43]